MFNSLFGAQDLAGAANLLPVNAATAVPAVAKATKAASGVTAFSAGEDAHDLVYYTKCMIAGAASCGITHTAIVPLDIVKCRMQVCESLVSLLLSSACP